MKALVDPTNALDHGLAAIRQEFQVAESFPPEVLAAAEVASKRVPTAHVDRTALPFVTLDPATSTDLDQAFLIERAGNDLLLRYAIADVAWFVDEDGAIDREAWKRGTTVYLPDGKANLYPRMLSEKAASLLPDGPRPAVVFAIRIDPDGNVRLDGAERALVHSRAKLAYDRVTDADLPPEFAELGDRMRRAEDRRGAARVDPPEQEVALNGDGHYQLVFRPRLVSEERNAALSLATNLAVADALLRHRTGLFRVMAEPDVKAVARLRHTASAFGLPWPVNEPLAQFERGLDPCNRLHAAFMLAIRRASAGTSYVPWQEGVLPWHAAMGATYAHATAPLRRLADRHVVLAALAIANGQDVPEAAASAFARLPQVMARAEAYAGRIERAVIDLAEAVMLRDRLGEIFPAVVTDVDERGLRLQLRDLPVVARMGGNGVVPGDALCVRLTGTDPERRTISFEKP